MPIGVALSNNVRRIEKTFVSRIVKTSDLVVWARIEYSGLHLFRPMYRVWVCLDTDLEEVALLVYGLPDFICFGSFNCDSLAAERAIYFWLQDLHG